MESSAVLNGQVGLRSSQSSQPWQSSAATMLRRWAWLVSLRFMTLVLVGVSSQAAFADGVAADCNSVINAANTAITARSTELNNRQTLSNQAVSNAKSCIDNMLQIIRNMSPTAPSFQSMSIDQIINYLTNRACAVATTTVVNAVSPIAAQANGAVNGAVGRVNGAAGGVTGGAVTNPIGQGGQSAGGSGSVSTTTGPTSSTGGGTGGGASSGWCFFGWGCGSGSNGQ